MSVPALYFASPYVPGDTPVTEISVRVHDTPIVLGDLKGTNFNYAEIEDNSPRIIFLRSEVEPARGMIVSVEPGVAYRVDTNRAPNDITTTSRVVRLTKDEAAGLPVPGDLIPINVRIEAIFPTFTVEASAVLPVAALGDLAFPAATVEGEGS
ncbi:hypothetical protein [Neoaquamicrobium sediminum]|uniref:hypothetical protein n=1 Tax=Neoaquamicrobium sediminum TaxID=1849104 RepID=UPI0015674E46|nr:hypothetical protein [Mesorhizobium sediminum]NRC54122.1 hypothetical protein [Mesorhizobium sediminum]